MGAPSLANGECPPVCRSPLLAVSLSRFLAAVFAEPFLIKILKQIKKFFLIFFPKGQCQEKSAFARRKHSFYSWMSRRYRYTKFSTPCTGCMSCIDLTVKNLLKITFLTRIPVPCTFYKKCCIAPF